MLLDAFYCASSMSLVIKKKVDIKLAQEIGFEFYQTRSNAIILYDTLPAYCIPKVVRMENEQIMYETVFASLRPKISMIGRKNWVQKLLDNQKAPNQPNQTLIQFIERGDL